ncbi:P-loop containing nucleoside triphosphate hydrolase protein [Aspergillus saccharolyticus JOP 1030-1]|uniref:P-loop containing nucleoside triphosphate hydrolase protein n=1 Tax=Aspergillus saccharolyticus JOP 1030-1 TaxID=1450539 RepID=A0A318Z960_9EURO|nr:P-loop containing nucleoside triphosphate hydrolase protein [Aspergillus saccharolyticus JOP 1030-1]PYH42937.1 P-loop containing nucleoside triphosphate hydrolase protein [Aspergillus saccharolyticus JOP 1030-1]
MLSHNSSSLVLGAVAVLVTALTSIPAGGSIIARAKQRRSEQDESAIDKNLYQDEDGEATDESVRSFSDKWQRVAVILFSTTGLLATLGLATLTTLQPATKNAVFSWLQFVLWVILLLQAVVLFVEPQSTQRYTLGQFAFLGSVVAILVAGLDLYQKDVFQHTVKPDDIWLYLVTTQLASALLRALGSLLLPRRPDVFHNGTLVDREFSGSALGRYSFAWANSLLDYTAKNRTLALTDLPRLRANTRADSLHRHLEHVQQSRKMWKALLRAHWRGLLMALALTVMVSILSLGPQMALLNILSALEARERGEWYPLRAGFWVFGLGALMFISSVFEMWLIWVVSSKLFVPIYAEISALVFAKSMRRKDVKSIQKAKKKTESQADGFATEIEEELDDEASVKKTRQSIINLAAVDGRRITQFATFSYLIPSSIFKLVLGCGFLIQILGWRSALSGIAVAFMVTPLNSFAAKRYTGAQVKLMKMRDQKLAIVTEVLQGIRQIKFSGLEAQWEARIHQAREKELQALWTSFLFDVILMAIWILGPIGLSAVSLTVYAVLHGGISASVAFTAMSVFSSLELSLAILPEIISQGLEAKVSSDRIDTYMDSPDRIVNTLPADKVAFDNASVAWPTEQGVEEPDRDRFVLRNLTLQFPAQGLSIVSGRTGAGKSLLLSSILGECDLLEGTIQVPVPPPIADRFDDRATSANWTVDSAIAYVAQIPWIENATIKANILFGLPYHEGRYQKTLAACALQKDLEMLPDGDLTDIGANGVNLSGGQRWRVSFARALYSRAGILVLDDIFSALDAHTGRHVYEDALTGELGQGRTRILVTHHVGLCLSRADYWVELEDGNVRYAGPVAEEQKKHHSAQVADDSDSNSTAVAEEETVEEVISHTTHRRLSTVQPDAAAGKQSSPKKFVEDEKREVGSVQLSIYKSYFSMGGHGPRWVLTAAIFLSYTSLVVTRAWWINVWTASSSQTHSSPELYSLALVQQPLVRPASAPVDSELKRYLLVYIAVSVLACLMGTMRFYLILSTSVRAARNLFKRLTYAVLRARMRWLDTVPLGRILNRFTSDFNYIDSTIGYQMGYTGTQILNVCGVIVAGVLVSPFVLILAAVLLTICLRLALRFLSGAREVKRLESTAKSPIFEHFGSSLAGLVTIRAFGKSSIYTGMIYERMNAHAQALWAMLLFNRWLSFRMNLVGALFATLTATLIVSMPSISASLAGFALSFALLFNTAISMALRSYTDVELSMNATERVIEYSNIELENQGGIDPPAAWPTEGRLEVQDLVVGYAPDLPPVLKGLSFSVEKNQRVGVVGRTGAGKSSLTLALFRILEAREGKVLIDGLDTAKLTLNSLRSRLAIIPQDPVLFSGTVRFNLDPFDEYTDTELYDALTRVHLISPDGAEAPAVAAGNPTYRPNANIFTSLSAPISEGGLNLSQGQRQLLCLARAIVSRPKIMFLDEATSAVDMETDALIQQSIRAEFGRNDTTLLVIAHRLSTIADFDRILVMDAGRAVEFGAPRELLGIENGVFRTLVDHSGEKELLEKIILEKE